MNNIKTINNEINSNETNNNIIHDNDIIDNANNSNNSNNDNDISNIQFTLEDILVNLILISKIENIKRNLYSEVA